MAGHHVESWSRSGTIVPLPFPAFWLAALSGLGEPIDWTVPLPEDNGIA